MKQKITTAKKAPAKRKLTKSDKELYLRTIEVLITVLDSTECVKPDLLKELIKGTDMDFKNTFDSNVDREYLKAKIMNLTKKI